MELHHDDLLNLDCLRRLRNTFEQQPDVGFVYSDAAQADEADRPVPFLFETNHGLQQTLRVVEGVERLSINSLAPTPHNVSYIWSAPNHRGWLRPREGRLRRPGPHCADLTAHGLPASA